MKYNRLQGLLLADGSEVPVACARALEAERVHIQALVVGPSVPLESAQAIVDQFSVKPPIIVTNRPDQDPYIESLIASRRIDYLFSCFYEHRIFPSLIEGARFGGTNIHPSVLPHNRGFHTSFWGIMSRTPLGATIHWLAEGLDEGDIIAQEIFFDDGTLSAAEIRCRQRDLCVSLFNKNLPLILAGKAQRKPQEKGGEYHFKKDIVAATTFRSCDSVSFEQLLHLVRATDYGKNGLTVVMDGRKFKITGHVSEV